MKKILLLTLCIITCIVTWIGIIAFFYSFEPSVGGLVFVCMFSAIGFTTAYLMYDESLKIEKKEQHH